MSITAEATRQTTETAVSDFIGHWHNTDGKERANYQLFLPEHPGLTMTGMYNVLEKLRRQALPGSTEPPLTAMDTAEEAQGKVRWLRPEYQALEETGTQGELGTSGESAVAATKTPKVLKNKSGQNQCRSRCGLFGRSFQVHPWTYPLWLRSTSVSQKNP